MEYLYIDESGSMTTDYIGDNPCFIIAIVRAKDPVILRKCHKRFVSKYISALKAADKNRRMFKGENFYELKGSMFTPELKRKFATYFNRPEAIELFYIVMDNSAINAELYLNKARAFNYVLKLALSYFLSKGFLDDGEILIQIDERNEKTETKYFLQNYLNTELRPSGILSKDTTVKYFDSSNNRIIQIADVFSNLYYSHCRSNGYDDVFRMLRDSGCLKNIFVFPKDSQHDVINNTKKYRPSAQTDGRP